MLEVLQPPHCAKRRPSSKRRSGSRTRRHDLEYLQTPVRDSPHRQTNVRGKRDLRVHVFYCPRLSGALARNGRPFTNLYKTYYKRVLEPAVLRSFRRGRQRMGSYADSSTKHTQLQHRDRSHIDPEHHPPHVRPGHRRWSCAELMESVRRARLAGQARGAVQTARQYIHGGHLRDCLCGWRVQVEAPHGAGAESPRRWR